MFAGEDFNSPQQFSVRNSPCLEKMAPFQVGQKRSFPYNQPPVFASQIALTGKPTYDSHCLNTAQQTVLGGGLLTPQTPPCYSGIPSINDFKSSYDSHWLNTAQQTGLGRGLLKPQAPPYCYGILSIKSDFPFAFGVGDKPVHLPPQKKFLIFDQSKDRTRLFFGPSLLPPPLDQTTTSKPPTDGSDRKRVESQMDRHFLVKWDEKKIDR